MIKNIPIGIMQGRLLPPVQGQLQAFPGRNWEEEFPLAHQCGLDTIEMIFDSDGIEWNPLNYETGLEHIQRASETYGVKVLSVCADYFKAKGFLKVTDQERMENIRMLEKLTILCSKIGVKYIVIPFLEQSEVRTKKDLDFVRTSLLTALERTNGCNVIYALEMSLPAEKIASFLKDTKHPLLNVNYDTGNSTALGYNVISEIEHLAQWIVGVHIKDRKIGGGSCILGSGDTDFDGVFNALARINFKSLFILEAQRGNDEVKIAKRYVSFVKDKIEQYYTKEH